MNSKNSVQVYVYTSSPCPPPPPPPAEKDFHDFGNCPPPFFLIVKNFWISLPPHSPYCLSEMMICA